MSEAVGTRGSVLYNFVCGPPGTGKTHTLARVTETFLRRGMRVLVVAHSNVAVDEAAMDIADLLHDTPWYQNYEILRLGHHRNEGFAQHERILFDQYVEMLARRRTGAHQDCGDHDLSPHGIRSADDARVLRSRVALQHALDLSRIDIFSPGHHQIRSAIHHIEVPVGVEIPEIACEQPAAAQDLCGIARSPVVPRMTTGPRTRISPTCPGAVRRRPEAAIRSSAGNNAWPADPVFRDTSSGARVATWDAVSVSP